jgi:hypothetical protein
MQSVDHVGYQLGADGFQSRHDSLTGRLCQGFDDSMMTARDSKARIHVEVQPLLPSLAVEGRS